MWIGIDMLGVQSPGGVGRQSGRFGRQLIAAMLALDPVNRYLLYSHEGLSTEAIPSARNAERVALGGSSGPGHPRRAAIQRLLDRNPEGLDWLLLLDPFEEGYGGRPPEAPLHGPRVASIVHELAPTDGDDGRLGPLRRHDAVLAVTRVIAEQCRRRLGLAARRVSEIGLACDLAADAVGPHEPLTRVAGDELGRLGISGPFLLVGTGGRATRDDLESILDAYRRLPIGQRRRHQLVIAGPVDDPAAVRAFLRDRGSEQGLVLADGLSEASLAILHGRCSAFLVSSSEMGASLALVEAMRSGAPVIARRSPARLEVVGDAGLLVDPDDPTGLASALDALLSDPNLDRELRRRALARSSRFGFKPVVDAVLETLGRAATPGSSRIRFDRAHLSRPRIAIFPDVHRDAQGRVNPASLLPEVGRETYRVDYYVEPGGSTSIDHIPPTFGGFDARLFDRNDAILGYHAVVYRVADVAGLDAILDRLRKRPGLVWLRDDGWLDPVGWGGEGGLADPTVRLREVFRTGSRVVVPSPRLFERIGACFPEYLDQLAEIPPALPSDHDSGPSRESARARFNLDPGSLVIGQFGSPVSPLLTPRAFRAVARAAPEVVLLSFDAGRDAGKVRREAATLGLGDRFIHIGTVSPGEALGMVAWLDLAIHPGGAGSPTVDDLLRAGIPTISLGPGFPDSVVLNLGPTEAGELDRLVRDLAGDPEARSALGRSALAYSVGTPDPERASALLLEQVERCGAEIPRVGGGRRRRPAERPRGLVFFPHFRRPASSTGEAIPRTR